MKENPFDEKYICPSYKGLQQPQYSAFAKWASSRLHQTDQYGLSAFYKPIILNR